MTNYEKICWSCGSKNMEPVETWFKCRDCGATHVNIPRPGPEILERGYGGGNMDTEGRGRPAGRPSKAATLAAAKAREEAEAKEKAYVSGES